MNSFLHQASFATGYWYYDRHRSVRLVILVGLAIDQIAQSGLSSLSVIYYSAQLFRRFPAQRPLPLQPLPRADTAFLGNNKIHGRQVLSGNRLAWGVRTAGDHWLKDE
ncbi:hypothetical protein P9912_008265 [Serratia nevei]|uniref:hypothetical protein n=1 Tax=Serratia nevei TaxID=2703794 RepID=UPI002E1857C9|nr:hypothetical protein [Serratia nevei]MEC5733584.1 hypothetical protein [Serratia nevei]